MECISDTYHRIRSPAPAWFLYLHVCTCTYIPNRGPWETAHSFNGTQFGGSFRSPIRFYRKKLPHRRPISVGTVSKAVMSALSALKPKLKGALEFFEHHLTHEENRLSPALRKNLNVPMSRETLQEVWRPFLDVWTSSEF